MGLNLIKESIKKIKIKEKDVFLCFMTVLLVFNDVVSA